MARAFVCGCLGRRLDDDERAFLKDADPLGVILFKRNIGTPDEVLALTSDIRAVLGRDAFVLVDQEGGRVQRIGPPHWRKYPAAARFSSIADPVSRGAAVRAAARLIGMDLRALGIDVDCLPVLDVPVQGAHDVIGDRAYGQDPGRVAELGRAAAEGLLDAGVLPVMKHLPGHGRAGADSHLALPVVDATLAELAAADFEPFRQNNDLPAGMTAHVVYTAIDATRPATISPTIVRDIIRGTIGFDGLLFSDDLSMKALPGTFREKAEGLFAAGVDIALHCNGDRQEAGAIAAATPLLDGEALRRVEAARATMTRVADGATNGSSDPFDPVDAARTIDELLAATA